MSADPRTVEEWDDYFSRYNADQLLSKAKVMNNISFVRMLRREDYEMEEIQGVMTVLSRRLMSAGELPPPGEFDLRGLVDGDPLADLDALPIPTEPFDDRQEPTNMDRLGEEVE